MISGTGTTITDADVVDLLAALTTDGFSPKGHQGEMRLRCLFA
jgi:hypothetical protein